MPDDAKLLRCSFCNKSQRDVKKLIAGPMVYICDECIDVCNDILAEDGIMAGHGAKAGLRAAGHAEEYLQAARELLRAGQYLTAAREVRNAALAAFRGLGTIDDSGADRWSETKTVMNALESRPEIGPLLHVDDAAHVILRVTVDGATLRQDEVENSIGVTEKIIAILRASAEAAAAQRPKRTGPPA